MARASTSPSRRTTRSASKRLTAASHTPSPSAGKAQASAKKTKAAPADPWENSDGCHGTPFYCLGRPKPLLRGTLHFYSALSSPLWSGYQLSLCHTAQEVWAVLLACVGATCMLGASGGYHYPSWRTEAQEVLMGKMDYGGIYLQIAFSFAPMYLLLLPAPVNWAVIGSMAVCAACGIFLTFGPIGHLGRHAGAVVYIVMGLVQTLPLLTSAFSERTMWSQLLTSEQNLLIALAAAYLVGSQIYANATPKLWPSTFGFHELWHLLVVIGSAASWAVNCSLLQRREALLYYAASL
mmetsp:Transcript_8405/g.12551  ORF Transcript_8405/g.12551 Transcript_8405/m.12551 type:complete len:294 (+) Transcript_8405:334-1215(+)